MSRLPDGNYAIILTPLTENRELDLNGLEAELEYALSKKVAGVVVLGSNGEGPYFTDREKAMVVKKAGETVKGKAALVAGCIAVGTQPALEFSRMAKGAGCDSVLAALPAYFGLDFPEALRHYRYLAEHAGLEITLYYVPDNTGLSLKPEEIAELVSIRGVDSMKLTRFHRDFMLQTTQLCAGKECKVFIGTSLLLFEGSKMDGKGSFCPINLVAPEEVTELFSLCQNQRWEAAFALQEKIRRGGAALISGRELDYDLAKNGFMDGFNAPSASAVIHHPKPAHHLLKEALRLKGIPISNQVRLPYDRVTPQQSEWVKKALKDFGWL